MNPEETHGFQNSLLVNQGILPNQRFFFFLIHIVSVLFLVFRNQPISIPHNSF